MFRAFRAYHQER